MAIWAKNVKYERKLTKVWIKILFKFLKANFIGLFFIGLRRHFKILQILKDFSPEKKENFITIVIFLKESFLKNYGLYLLKNVHLV